MIYILTWETSIPYIATWHRIGNHFWPINGSWQLQHTGNYGQTSNINHTLVCNETVDHCNAVGASPAGAAPTASSFSTLQMASIYCTKTIARWDDKHLSFLLIQQFNWKWNEYTIKPIITWSSITWRPWYKLGDVDCAHLGENWLYFEGICQLIHTYLSASQS